MKTLQIKQAAWDLSPLFKNDDDPEMEKQRKIIEEKNYKFINKWKNRDDYLKNPKILKEALDEYEALNKNYGVDGNEGYYLWLRTQQDQNSSNLKAKFNKIEDFGNKIRNEIQFFYLKIAQIPLKLQQKFLNDKKLEPYKHYLEKAFLEATYLLSDEEEKILNLKSAPAYSNWVKMTSSFLGREEREVLLEDGTKKLKNFSEILSLLSNKNKKVRDAAAKNFNEILAKYVEIGEVEINSVLTNKKIDDELRKLPRPDSSRHISDDIDTDIIDTLTKAVSKRFDIAKRYYKLKANLLGFKKLGYHERNVEYGDLDKKYSYQEAVNLVYQVFSNLNEKFRSILEEYIVNNQIDTHPRKNKRDGAFCAGEGSIALPTYILLNHTDTLHDVLTIAHELGHGINNELMREKQNSLNFGTPLSLAEVASTFMEDFVLEELTKEADDELRLTIMMMKLNEDVSTIFRQVACYMFEQELHKTFREKGYLSKEAIGKLFQKHMKAYMGDSVEQSPGSENWWVYWSHIRNFFYNYSYANGLLISKSLQASVRKDPKFINKVKDFLSAGMSDSPKNIFKSLGIDITDQKFWDQGLDEVESLLKETEALAKKLGKLKT